ncbi:MAG: LON peptidase substrate-binding domain-containing protein [Sediminibacterium sp.]|nr:LON peptidase substrate-binding domain-containing protein [Sediminibacterium sp.]MCA6441721.1 LON peptidase substrate-binding domain-containing protein [Chitinophagaceae bacterium]MCA6447495.1 LON peptidase substrate-binding domain-containing protein [Chitinophagaceae bacterium]
MINFIPIFPLSIVVFPGETLNLHIFEPRYRQLIQECFAEQKPFGIPTVLQKGIADLGTLVEITEIVTVHEDGKMDIRTRGLKVFSILELIKSIPEKLYSGAIVNYPDNNMKHDLAFIRKVIASIRELHKFLNISKDFKKKEEELFSYDIAHHAGLSVEEEYEFLGLLEEAQRLEYLKRHLNKVIPIVAGMESLKDKIKLNGHFRELKGFNFDA